MLGLGKKREFLLKFLCGAVVLFALSFLSWGFTWAGALVLLAIAVSLHYNSTSWILKKLDLGPNPRPSEDIHLQPVIDRLSKKYEIKSPFLYKTQVPAPLVMGIGGKDSSIIAVSAPFFNKLSPNEKEALLEIAIYKIETQFCKNIEFIIHLNSAILFVGSKMDLVIAFILGLKRNKEIETHHHILFSRISILAIRIINFFYMNRSAFTQFDQMTYQNNSHLVLALNKTLIYSPMEKKTVNPLLCPFNFCNLPRYVSWHRHLEIQPDIETRLFNLQKDRNLMLESLTV